MMPDVGGVKERVRRALVAQRPPILWPQVEFLEMPIEDGPADTLLAVEKMVAAEVAVIVVLGGDGTHRLAATACGNTPLLALSTGTNNAFGEVREGTVAGLAAGLVAAGKVSIAEATNANKTLHVEINDTRRDLALVDVAVSSSLWIGSKALWRPEVLCQVFVAFAEASAMGLSSVAGLLQPVSRHVSHGLRVDLAPPEAAAITVIAPIAPGLVLPLGVSAVCKMRPGEPQILQLPMGVITLDGEREIEFTPDQRVTVILENHGPRTIDVDRVMSVAARDGLLATRRPAGREESTGYATQQG